MVSEIERTTGNDRLYWYNADLADLTQVAEVAERIAADHPYLDALVNNAGIGPDVPGGPARQESVDGHELRFAVNYLAGFSLTRRLLSPLQGAARERGSARVVLVSSAGQAPIDVDDLMLHRHYDGWTAYCRSKLAQIMFAFDLADELQGRGVTANALHPATYMPTKIVPSPISTLAEGVESTARLVTDPALERVSGRYFDGLHEAQPNRQAFDPEVRRRLRDGLLCAHGAPPVGGSRGVGRRRQSATWSGSIAPMPNTAPWSSITTEPRPNDMSLGGMSTLPPSSVTRCADASQSSTENQTDQAGNSPSPAVCAPQMTLPPRVKMAASSPDEPASTPHPNTVV